MRLFFCAEDIRACAFFKPKLGFKHMACFHADDSRVAILFETVMFCSFSQARQQKPVASGVRRVLHTARSLYRAGLLHGQKHVHAR